MSEERIIIILKSGKELQGWIDDDEFEVLCESLHGHNKNANEFVSIIYSETDKAIYIKVDEIVAWGLD